MTENRRICRTCGQDGEWHRATRPRHRFLSEDGVFGLDPIPGPAAPPETPLSGDPALRVALLEKGLLSLEELDAAQEKLRVLAGRPGGYVVKVPPAENAERAADGSG